MAVNAESDPAAVPLHHLSDGERMHPMVVFGHENEFQQLRQFVDQSEQYPRSFNDADESLRAQFPAYNVARAAHAADNHPLSTDGLDEAIAAAERDGEATAVLSELACFPLPPRDIFPLDSNSPGPSAMHMRCRSTMVEQLLPGCFSLFRDVFRPCLTPASEGRQERCGLKNPSDPPVQRWRDISRLFLRLFLSCARFHRIRIVAHFVGGKWAALETGMVQPGQPLDLSVSSANSPVTRIPTYPGHHSRYNLGTPHVVVRSLSIARESSQLSLLRTAQGLAPTPVEVIYSGYTWLLESNPPQPLAQSLTFLPFATLVGGLGIDPQSPATELFDTFSTALREYLDTFGAIHTPAGPAILVCTTTPAGPLTTDTVGRSLSKEGIDVAGWSAQKLWRRFGKMYGGKGRRRFLETHGVENVLEMTPEEVNTRWGLECRRVYLIEHCEMKEAIDFSDEEVGRFWYERVSKDFLKEKAGLSDSEINAMTPEELNKKHIVEVKRDYLRRNGHLAVDQYDDAKVALEHARLVRPWEGRKKRDKKAAMIEDEQEEEYLALEALEALQRLQSNEARSRHVSATKRLQITNELDKSGNYYSHASELFGNKAVKEYWDVNASTASGTDSRSVRVSMLEKSLRSVVRRTPGADWPKRKRPRPGQSEPSDVISIGTFFLNQSRNGTKDVKDFLTASGISTIKLSDSYADEELRGDFKNRFEASEWLSGAWDYGKFAQLSNAECRWIAMALDSGYIEYSVDEDEAEDDAEGEQKGEMDYHQEEEVAEEKGKEKAEVEHKDKEEEDDDAEEAGAEA